MPDEKLDHLGDFSKNEEQQLRRDSDRILLKSITTLGGSFKELTHEVRGISSTQKSHDTTLKLILNQTAQIERQQREHHKLLWGNPETMGEGGLVATVRSTRQDLKAELKHKASLYGIVGAILLAAWSAVLTWFRR